MTGDTKITHVGGLKPGNYVIMDGIACVVKSIQTSRPGKHGHAKCRLEAVGILEGQKKIQVFPAHDNISVPIIGKKNGQVLSVSGDMASVMDLESFETFEMKIPEELKDKITDGTQVLYWVVLDSKIIKQVK